VGDSESSGAVLVVEDELMIRIMAADHLQEAGFEVHEAARADAAIPILEAHSEIRLLFTDVKMPGSMDGLKLAQYVQRRWPGVKIIVTSGHVRVPPRRPSIRRFVSAKAL
jgi:DNA-binding NtrC family response regulator